MAAKRGFYKGVMLLRGHRYWGTIEVKVDETQMHDVLDAWQALYSPP